MAPQHTATSPLALATSSVAAQFKGKAPSANRIGHRVGKLIQQLEELVVYDEDGECPRTRHNKQMFTLLDSLDDVELFLYEHDVPSTLKELRRTQKAAQKLGLTFCEDLFLLVGALPPQKIIRSNVDRPSWWVSRRH